MGLLDLYWAPSQDQQMVLPFALVHFDDAVLLGVGGAIKFLQEALGIKMNSSFDPKTQGVLKSANASSTAIEIINQD